MTQVALLRLLVLHARSNGFDFRAWFQSNIEPAWSGSKAAVALLATRRLYYALLFSHDFARHFWKPGAQISFLVPASEYIRRKKDGSVVTISRKRFTRRTLKPNVWKYHLREMAAAEDPLLYIRRFVITREDLSNSNS